MSQSTLIEAIRSRFMAQVATPNALSVIYDNAPAPETKTKWARITVLPQNQQQSSSGGATVVYRTTGVAVVNVFTPAAAGDKESLALCDAVIAAFRGVKLATPDITFTPAPTIQGAAQRDEAGSWWIRTVEIRWRADEAIARVA